MLAIEHAKLREGEERGEGREKEEEEREERGGGGGERRRRGGGEKDDTVHVCVHVLTLLISQSCQPKTR